MHIFGRRPLPGALGVPDARYRYHLGGRGRSVVPGGMVWGPRLRVFVAIAQAFRKKVPAPPALASTAAETPFVMAQLMALALFIVAGAAAVAASVR